MKKFFDYIYLVMVVVLFYWSGYMYFTTDILAEKILYLFCLNAAVGGAMIDMSTYKISKKLKDISE